MATPFSDINNAAGERDRSLNWYMSAVRKMASSIKTPGSVMKSDLGETTGEIELGNLYLYTYNAKMEAELPYYDLFPLCMPFSYNNNGFNAINFHYLSPMLRLKLMSKLLDYTDTEIDKDSIFNIEWDSLASKSKFPEVRPAVKRYLYSQVKSRFIKVNPEHWKAAVFLPVSNFNNVSNQTVWRQSRDKI